MNPAFSGSVRHDSVPRFRTASLAVFSLILGLAGTRADLVVRFPLNEGSGMATAGNVPVGAAMSGTVTGASWTTGVVGSCLAFNGAGARVSIPDDARLTPATALSVSCWVNPAIAGQIDKQLVAKINGAGTAGYRLLVMQSAGATVVAWQIPSTAGAWGYGLTSSAPLTVNAWNHVVGTYDGATMRLYVNGTFAGSLARVGAVGASGTNLILGAFDGTGTASFNGQIDDVRIFSHALGQAEVTALAQQDLRFCMPFAEGMGSTTVDVEAAIQGAISLGSWVSPGYASPYALSFGGAMGSMVQIPDGPDVQTPNAVTVACRVNIPAAQSSHLLSNLNDAGTAGFRLKISGTTPGWQIPSPGSPWGYTLTATNNLSTNAWNHVAATYDGTTMKIYVNGVASGSLARSGTITPSGKDLALAAVNTFGSNALDGTIDDVRVYGHALTDAEVAEIAAIPVQDVMGVKRGDTIFFRDFETAQERREWPAGAYRSWSSPGAAGSGTAMKIVGDYGVDYTGISLDLVPYRGMKLYLETYVMASGVTLGGSPLPTQGIKYMLKVAKADGTFEFPQLPIVAGTFGWTQVGFDYVVPDNAVQVTLCAGLENSVGTVYFDKLAIYCMQDWETMHRPAPSGGAAPDPGHAGFARLRGVMSPHTMPVVPPSGGTPLYGGSSFSTGDFTALASWTVGGHAACPNLVRWQMKFNGPGSETDWTQYQAWLTTELADVSKMLAFAKANGWMVVVDLHTPPGGLNPDSSHKIFYDATLNADYIQTWRTIATTLKSDPSYSAIWGYDLVNEPIEKKPAPSGLGVFASEISAARAIRAIDTNVTLIAETDDYTSPAGFNVLVPFPADVTKVVYELHMYAPDYYCLQGLTSSSPLLTAPYDTYPGNLKNGSTWVDQTTLSEILAPVREFQQAYNVPIYVGEFSAVRYAKGCAQYLADNIDLFESYNWDWSFHAYRESPDWDAERPASPISPVPARNPSGTYTDRQTALMDCRTNTPSIGGYQKNWPAPGMP